MAFGSDGNGKGQEPGRGFDGGRVRGADDQGRNTMVNGGSAEGRSNFNPTGRYNPGHERGRSYSGHTEAIGTLIHASMDLPDVELVSVELASKELDSLLHMGLVLMYR
jgi:hypothetical protein